MKEVGAWGCGPGWGGGGGLVGVVGRERGVGWDWEGGGWERGYAPPHFVRAGVCQKSSRRMVSHRSVLIATGAASSVVIVGDSLSVPFLGLSRGEGGPGEATLASSRGSIPFQPMRMRMRLMALWLANVGSYLLPRSPPPRRGWGGLWAGLRRRGVARVTVLGGCR